MNAPSVQFRHPTHGLRAFTLTELLMVVAIIGILVSMLFPVLNMARSSARSAVCKSNMRQIYLGVIDYASNWNDYTPSNCFYDPSPGSLNSKAVGENWGQALAVHMGIRLGTYGQGTSLGPAVIMEGNPAATRRCGIFNCPENRNQTFQMGMNGTSTWPPGSMPNPHTETSYSGNGVGTLEQTWFQPWSTRFFGMPLARMQHLSELMAFWDGDYYQNWANDDDGLGTLPYRGIGVRNVRYRHFNRANVMFADGHLESKGLLRGHGSPTSVPVVTPMRAASWDNGKAWWSID